VQWSSNRQDAGSTLTYSIASNLQQVANLQCAQANSTSYPQRDGKWLVAYLAWATGWRPSLADWGSGMSASCMVQLSVSVGNGWPYIALRYH